MTQEEMLNKEAEFKNSNRFDPYDGVDCPICKNRGYIAVVKNGYVIDEECECLIERRVNLYLEKSGLSDIAKRYTFENYVETEAWQKGIKKLALEYVEKDWNKHWFFIGGQSGVGKTFICTAIEIALMKKGLKGYYMLWQDEIARIRALKFQSDKLDDTLDKLTNVKVLYIDDLFKAYNGQIDKEDFNLTMNLLNIRYKENKTTIISTELTLDEIKNLDRALGGRIYERTTEKYSLSITKNDEKDYRKKF